MIQILLCKGSKYHNCCCMDFGGDIRLMIFYRRIRYWCYTRFSQIHHITFDKNLLEFCGNVSIEFFCLSKTKIPQDYRKELTTKIIYCFFKENRRPYPISSLSLQGELEQDDHEQDGLQIWEEDRKLLLGNKITEAASLTPNTEFVLRT